MGTMTVKAAAIMTAPRYENTYCRNAIQRGLQPLGIPLTVSGGVYYGQCMQKMLEQLCNTDCEYAITIDGDSLFTAAQLQRLLSIIHQEPDIDAITGIQVRRGRPAMLGTVDGGVIIGDDEKKVDWDGSPIKAKTAHFGLTVISIEKLRHVKKPWFVSIPNDKGEWDGDKIDCDVYFWLQWEEAGNSIYIDPHTRLGHMEEMVAIHDESMQPIHIYLSQWEEMRDGCCN